MTNYDAAYELEDHEDEVIERHGNVRSKSVDIVQAQSEYENFHPNTDMVDK